MKRAAFLGPIVCILTETRLNLKPQYILLYKLRYCIIFDIIVYYIFFMYYEPETKP